MTEKNNHRQDIEIAEVCRDVTWLRRKVDNIEVQVFNHIPTQIQDINKKVDRVIIGIILGTAAIVLTQIFTNLL